MSEKSENRPEMTPVVGDRRECHESGAAANDVTETPNRDELRGILANRGRQWVLRCLVTAETPMALADLADELVRRVADASPTAVQDERERVYALLYHYHLPKLAESGRVSFDTERKIVDLREDAGKPSLDADRTTAEERPREGL